MSHTSLIPEYHSLPTAEKVVDDLNKGLPPHAEPVTVYEIECVFETAHIASRTEQDFLHNVNWLILLTYDTHCD